MDLQTMSIEELEELSKKINDEIRLRKAKESGVLFTPRCKGSANHHMRKYKHWTKILTGIDDTKTNGYAFLGDFISSSKEHLLPIGTILIDVCDSDYGVFEIIDHDETKLLIKYEGGSFYKFILKVKEILEGKC